jgi:hypothetical protein
MTTHRTTETTRRGGGRFRRSRVVGPLGVALIALLFASCNWSTDANRLTALDAQEESFFSDGDEPYMAVIQFRVTPGVPNSTQVQYLGHLQEIATNIDDGDSASIPDAMGRAQFPNAIPVDAAGLARGQAPEIVGVVTVAMESDASPFSAINGIMGDVTAELDNQLRTQIETLSFADILDPSVAGDRLAEAARRVQAAAEPSFWEAVGIWFSSFGDPDDVIGFKVLFFVSVANDIAPLVDQKLASGLPDTVIGRSLSEGPLDVTYAGDGATYQVHWDIDDADT